jgi:hypothetical protein
LNSTLAHDDTFGPQQLRLLALVAGNQPTVDVHDPPPRDVERRRRQDPANETRSFGVTRDVGDVAVRGHLAWAEGQDHVDDASLAAVHDTILAAS